MDYGIRKQQTRLTNSRVKLFQMFQFFLRFWINGSFIFTLYFSIYDISAAAGTTSNTAATHYKIRLSLVHYSFIRNYKNKIISTVYGYWS